MYRGFDSDLLESFGQMCRGFNENTHFKRLLDFKLKMLSKEVFYLCGFSFRKYWVIGYDGIEWWLVLLELQKDKSIIYNIMWHVMLYLNEQTFGQIWWKNTPTVYQKKHNNYILVFWTTWGCIMTHFFLDELFLYEKANSSAKINTNKTFCLNQIKNNIYFSNARHFPLFYYSKSLMFLLPFV